MTHTIYFHHFPSRDWKLVIVCQVTPTKGSAAVRHTLKQKPCIACFLRFKQLIYFSCETIRWWPEHTKIARLSTSVRVQSERKCTWTYLYSCPWMCCLCSLVHRLFRVLRDGRPCVISVSQLWSCDITAGLPFISFKNAANWFWRHNSELG